MARVDIGGKKSGNIWMKRPEGKHKDSLLLEVTNTIPGPTPHNGRRLLFTHVAFGRHGSWLVCSDQLGDLYLLDLTRNRYSMVYRVGRAITALSCCLTRPSEVLVGLVDHSVICIDIDTGELVTTLCGHSTAVKSFSLHSSGLLLLAVSSRDCILWNLDSFSRHRTLRGGQDVGVQDVFFQPLTNVIISCFKDDSIHAWDSATLEYLYHLPPPPPPLSRCCLDASSPHFRAFAITEDGRVMVGAGRSPYIHIWDLNKQQLVKAVELPKSVREVKQLIFPPLHLHRGTSKVLGVLAQDGVLYWLDMESYRLVTQTGSHDLPLSHAHTSQDGQYLSALSERGSILIYNVSDIAKKLTQSSVPVIKVRECGKENDSNSTNKQQQRDGERRRKRNLGPGNQYNSLHKQSVLCPPDSEREGRGGEGGGREGGGGDSLNQGKLVAILKTFGEYPAKYRAFIWRSILHLPGNHSSYSTLLERGTHSAYTNLHRVYPLRSERLTRILQRTLSALAHWSPVFGETPYLPSLVFPFIKMFQNNQLVTFELLATFLSNWCGNWFDYFPNPPLNLLAMVENCLAHHDSSLLRHLISHNITSQHYAWPLMSTVFSEVLTRSQWLRVWDHVFSNHPGFFLLLTTSILTSSRSTLLRCSSHSDFQQFLHHPPAVDVGVVIREAYRMQDTTPHEIHPEKLLSSLVPLTTGTYPVFNKYPKFIVNYQSRERDKIRKEEEEYLRQRQGVLEMERLRETRRVEEEAWFRQQQLLLDAEEERRKMLSLEEAKLANQRKRLMAMKREMQVRELKEMDTTRKDFLHHQQRVKEARIKRLDDQIKKRVVQRETETQEALEEAEVKALELERQRVQLQHQLARYQQEMEGQLDMEEEMEDHGLSVQQCNREKERREGGEKERERLATAQAKLASSQVRQKCTETILEVGRRREEAEEEETEIHKLVAEGVEDHREKMKEVEELTRRLEKSQIHNLKPAEDEGGVGERKGEGGGEEMRSMKNHSLTHSPAISSLLWSKRRDQLDRQEADLVRRVQGIREKVVGHMTRQYRSHDRKTAVVTETSNS